MAHPFLSIGFRPFYLGAAVFATLAIPHWVISFAQGGGTSHALSAMEWHVHEMLFGFAPAVIVGFLLTSVRNWTGRPTVSGSALAGLFLLWIAGRVLVYLSGGTLSAAVDLAFLPAASICLARPLLAARNSRNFFVVGILLALFFANLTFYAAVLGWGTFLTRSAATTTALNMISILLVVIAGRVIPAFSANAIASIVRVRVPLLDQAAIGIMLLITAIDLLASAGIALTDTGYRLLLLTAAAIHLIRLMTWQPWKTWRNLLLLVLPLAYLWIPAYLLLRALLDGAPGQIPSPAAHALTVGAMSGLMLSMMTRSALGHTGRSLRAGRIEATCFAAIHGAALLRVAMVLLEPTSYLLWLGASAALWALAFGVFAAGYLKILTAPRLDEPASS